MSLIAESVPRSSPVRSLLLAMFSSLWIADAVLTALIVLAVGNTGEANPLMKLVLDHAGIVGLFGVKAAVLVMYWYLSPRIKTWLQVVACIAAFPAVVIGILFVTSIQ